MTEEQRTLLAEAIASGQVPASAIVEHHEAGEVSGIALTADMTVGECVWLGSGDSLTVADSAICGFNEIAAVTQIGPLIVSHAENRISLDPDWAGTVDEAAQEVLDALETLFANR